ncbi:unnamed protein product [Allacma fusca]|uniref:Uncharacterized protein n=1 Tax=Allacma fusca TaxID=39272 RepID=A0A8J2KLF8_9HEXA|nr:unnamed protein product [Allacma fusca]
MTPTFASVLAFVLLIHAVVGVPPYFYDDFTSADFAVDGPSDTSDRGDLNVDRLLHGMNKRSCIRRGARCDHRPDDCCSGGACRCNLWGTNCQCQRMGIFQKWG